MERRITALMAAMAERHAAMRATWHGAFLSPVILVLGFCLLIIGIVILPTPAPGWLLIFASLGLLSLVHPPMRRSMSAWHGFTTPPRHGCAIGTGSPAWRWRRR